jgi:ABC-type uncharacterized transport system substrate-binding protein
MTTRRPILFAAGVCLLAAPLISLSQRPPKLWRIGFLSARGHPASLDADFYGGFPRGMRELGYVEGGNVVFEWRFANGNAESLSGMAVELVRLNVDVIVTAGKAATGAAQKATTTIPIVMGAVADPVGSGLVASLSHPGGNITGLSNLSGDLRSKHLEMLLRVMPALTRVGVMMNPADQTTIVNLQIEAQKSNVTILPAQAQVPQQIEGAFTGLARDNAGALIVSLNPLFVQQRRQIADLAVKHHLPSISPNREFAEVGGLMSYGQNQADSYRRAATYVDKILKGAKPAELPIEQPTKFELVINMKTAEGLGIKIPQSILLRAERV